MSALECPVCRTALRETERDGVSIDTCPQCRGVWLDRGELEKLAAALVRPGLAASPPPRESYASVPPSGYERRRADFDDDDDDDWRHRGGYRSEKKSKMSRLLDFFD